MSGAIEMAASVVPAHPPPPAQPKNESSVRERSAEAPRQESESVRDAAAARAKQVTMAADELASPDADQSRSGGSDHVDLYV
jgi:hypothetical protein